MLDRILILIAAAIAGSACSADAPALETLEDMEFSAFVDIDGDGRCYNDEPRTIWLSDFLTPDRPGTRILMLNAAAGWCGPCMREAAALREFAAAYEPRGVVILTAVFQDQNGKPADAEFTRLWAESFELPNPTLVDSSFKTGKYFDASAMPANMFVDATTGEILKIATGAETGDDPMQRYRELLDHYLQ